MSLLSALDFSVSNPVCQAPRKIDKDVILQAISVPLLNLDENKSYIIARKLLAK
nr:MAG TPA: hypothetical protein [Caudoviricetes sp.]